MIKVTWEWLGMAPALDLADTVTVEDGAEHDLISAPGDFRRWAERAASLLPGGSAALLERHRPALIDLRETIRRVLGRVSAGERPPRRAIEELNRVSRRAPQWTELDPDALVARTRSSGSTADVLLAHYARSALALVAEDGDRLRRCPAPSCGMFYVATRGSQQWCSTQCGSRARVARHYSRRRPARSTG
jgi:predicted RNA-binding Zn ribbon-like protein